MTLATDFASNGMATTRVGASATTDIFGASGLAAEALPNGVTHVALVPTAAAVYFNIGGSANSSTGLLPIGGIVLNADHTPLKEIELYAAAATNVHVIIGGKRGKVVLGSGFAAGDIQIGAVELKDHDGTDRAAVNTSKELAVHDASAIGDLAKLSGSSYTYWQIPIDAAAGASTTIMAAPGADKQLWVMGYEFHAGTAAGTFLLESGGSAYTGTNPIALRGGAAREAGNAQAPLKKLGTNEALSITTVDCTIDGDAHGFVVTV